MFLHFTGRVRPSKAEEGMHPDPAGAVPVAGGAGLDVRAAARVNIVLGLAVAAIALVAATINPAGDFHRAQVRTNFNSSAPQCRTDRSTVLILAPSARMHA